MEQEKRISVLMGVYNNEKTVEAAVRSIQAQTWPDWELICCDDGSTDRSYEILCALANGDERIRVIRNERNHGLGYTLNRCFKASHGEYIARMDADDESCPERFAKELAYLELGECEIVSTALEFFGDAGETGPYPSIAYPKAEDFVRGSPFAHAACMMRRECMERVGGYCEDVSRLRVEDVDLWFRLLAAGYRFHNLDEALYRYCLDLAAIRRQKMKYRMNAARVRRECCRMLQLPRSCRLWCLRPVLVGLIPPGLRYQLHMWRRRQKKNGC